MILGTVEHVSVYFKGDLVYMDGVGGEPHIDSLLELFIRPI